MPRFTAVCAAVVIVGLLMLGFALEPARGPQSTFQEERISQ